MLIDKILFTPGPLTTSLSVKEAMLTDVGSRDKRFIDTVTEIRNSLLKLAGVSKDIGYEAVIMQGSGTFGIESVISSIVPRRGKLLIIINGAYGYRILKIAKLHEIDVLILRSDENEIPSIDELEALLEKDKLITHIAVVHCETTTGIINPISQIGALSVKYGKVLIVDAMSSFGSIPINMREAGIDFLISSSNKCIEGVPGFSFIIGRKEELEKAKGNADTLTLDLYDQWQGLEKDGQFRFTPPTHSLLAFRQALRELEEEGGPEGRALRYKANNDFLLEGMHDLGFKPYLPEKYRGYIITSFYYPEHPLFNFQEFYQFLSDQGSVIYPGKLSKVNCFRIGNIGKIGKKEISDLLGSIISYLSYYKFDL
jgi:2-aminoethylphosphonate-pyruvate transaminase